MQIIHIPEKPPVPPSQQPTVNVYASLIEPKHADALLRQLNQIAPLENLCHVKTIRKKHLEGAAIIVSKKISSIHDKAVNLHDTQDMHLKIGVVCDIMSSLSK